MASYREQLLKETYGRNYQHGYPQQEEEPAPVFLWFKLRFAVCLVLFGIFAYLSMTGKSIEGYSAETIVQAVVSDEIPAILPLD